MGVSRGDCLTTRRGQPVVSLVTQTLSGDARHPDPPPAPTDWPTRETHTLMHLDLSIAGHGQRSAVEVHSHS